MKRNIAIVLAGGTGSRMGADIPKQFLKFAGRTVLEHSVEAFEHHPDIDEVAVVVHPDYHAEVRAMAKRRGWKKLGRLVESGRERSDSSLHAIEAFEGEEEVNLVFHDAARPLVSAAVVSRVCEALKEHEAVGTGVPSVDTVMELEDGFLSRVPDRSNVQRMQTPQAFRLSVIREAYRRALADPAFRATDDCGVVLRYLPNTPIYIVSGEEENLKLTYAADLPQLERLYFARQPLSGPAPDAADPARFMQTYHRRHLRELQLAELDILVEVARLCERHDIPYWLDSGTLLGAVRHGGFIPWDDDIDICMPADALPRFTELARRELPPHLQVQTPQTEPSLRMPQCKVRNLNSLMVEGGDDFSKPYAKGLFIDIFPMEPWPSLPDSFTRRTARGYCRANAILHAQHTYSLRAAAELFYFGAKRAWLRACWTVAGLCAGKDKYYSNILCQSGNGNRHLRRTIFPLGRIAFEGMEFNAPADPDTYLRDLFGEYRQLPPEAQRTGHASFFIPKLVP